MTSGEGEWNERRSLQLIKCSLISFDGKCFSPSLWSRCLSLHFPPLLANQEERLFRQSVTEKSSNSRVIDWLAFVAEIEGELESLLTKWIKLNLYQEQKRMNEESRKWRPTLWFEWSTQGKFSCWRWRDGDKISAVTFTYILPILETVITRYLEKEHNFYTVKFFYMFCRIFSNIPPSMKHSCFFFHCNSFYFFHWQINHKRMDRRHVVLVFDLNAYKLYRYF